MGFTPAPIGIDPTRHSDVTNRDFELDPLV